MENISFTSSLAEITESELEGFFIGWDNPPSPSKHLKLLQNSSYFILAVDTQTKKVVGFITSITDKALAAYIPFLEVLPEYQGKGIGKELAVQMLKKLKGYYMVDLLCDSEVQSFYEKLGMKKATGMMLRNYDQRGGL